MTKLVLSLTIERWYERRFVFNYSVATLLKFVTNVLMFLFVPFFLFPSFSAESCTPTRRAFPRTSDAREYLYYERVLVLVPLFNSRVPT